MAAQSSKLERNNCLLLIAENYEKEGDERSLESHGGVSHFLYGKSLEYYLKIDRKEKITTIRRKIEKSGKNARKGMITLEIPIPDMSVEIEAAKNHVSEKESLRIALLFFSTVCILPSLKEIQEIAMKNTSVFDDVMSRIIIADDGRCVANIGGHSESGGDEILNHNIQRNLQIYIYMAVYGRILPALSQLKNDHSITLPILESLCESSELVPKGREKLTSYALWLGFDSDFGNAIHLLCPQFENMIRVELKRAGSQTRPILKGGTIEHEMALSNLMGLPECKEVFGEDLVFEIKSIFTDDLGSNLRNDVAHGLLDDNSSSCIESVYAWWMILKTIIHHRR
ncbi:hypothetical protein BMR11_16450 [Methylococcaceae bacterium CS5]|nr:hypothetical protein BMR10_17010 [Methylococcaceae bacterium CS4]TXK93698.1 hypothetical protein BMR11_16450 [Methylococcaceae bacterium CS5]